MMDEETLLARLFDAFLSYDPSGDAYVGEDDRPHDEALCLDGTFNLRAIAQAILCAS